MLQHRSMKKDFADTNAQIEKTEKLLKKLMNEKPINQKHSPILDELNASISELKQKLRTQNEALAKSQTELGTAQQKLADADTKLHAKENINSLNEVFIELNLEGNIVDANSKACEVLGYSRKKIIGKNWVNDFIPKEYQELNRKVLQKILSEKNTEIIKPVETPILTKNNTHGRIFWKSIIPKTKQGVMNSLQCTGEDVSKNKKTETQLLSEREQLKLVMESAHIGWWDWDIPSGKESYNDILPESLGYTLNEIKPHISWWENRIHKDDIQQVYQDLEKHFTKETTYYSNQHRLLCKSGQYEWFQDYGKVVERDLEGKPIRMIGTLRNIDKHKKAEKTILESEERFRFLSDVSFEGIVIHEDGILIDANHSFERISGYTKEEALGKNIFLGLVGEQALLQANRNIKKNHAKPYVVEAKRKNGEKFWAEIEGRDTIRNGKSIRIVAIRDVSEKINAQNAKKESEEKYRLVINNSQEGIFVAHNNRFVYVNPSIETLSGYSANELIGSDFVHYIAEEDRERINENNKNRLKGNKIPSYEFRFVHKNDGKRWVHIHATTINWEGKNAVLCFLTDIHNQKLAEKDLKASEKKFRTYIQSSPTAVFIANAQAKYTFVNQAAADMLGYTIDELLEKHIYEVVEPTRKENINSFRELKEKGIIESTEKKLCKKNGEIIDMHLDAVKISDNEFMAFCRDISKLKNYERELENANTQYRLLNQELQNSNKNLKQTNEDLKIAKQRAEESDRLKSAFLANMSHEIRTPMNGILGFANLLKESGLSGEKISKYIDIINRSGKRMLNIINDLIDISKIEAGQMEVHHSDVNINQIIEDQYHFFKQEVEQKGMQLQRHISLPDSLARINTDEEKLYAVLTNLIKNAIKYSTEGKIHFGYTYEDQSLEFFVKDSGIGIPIHRQDAIFDRFVQADIEDTKAKEGAGLGLAIAKAYVEMLGGNIRLRSKELIGTTFYFTLPYEIAAPSFPTETEKPTSKKTVNLQKILIVEDDETSSLHLSLTMKKIAKEIIYAKSGKKAVEICKAHPEIELILMDIKLPEMDGYTATKLIRKFNSNIIIIAQTAYALAGEKQKALDAGCNGYLSKPIDTQALFTELNQYF